MKMSVRMCCIAGVPLLAYRMVSVIGTIDMYSKTRTLKRILIAPHWCCHVEVESNWSLSIARDASQLAVPRKGRCSTQAVFGTKITMVAHQRATIYVAQLRLPATTTVLCAARGEMYLPINPTDSARRPMMLIPYVVLACFSYEPMKFVSSIRGKLEARVWESDFLNKKNS